MRAIEMAGGGGGGGGGGGHRRWKRARRRVSLASGAPMTRRVRAARLDPRGCGCCGLGGALAPPNWWGKVQFRSSLLLSLFCSFKRFLSLVKGRGKNDQSWQHPGSLYRRLLVGSCFSLQERHRSVCLFLFHGGAVRLQARLHPLRNAGEFRVIDMYPCASACAPSCPPDPIPSSTRLPGPHDSAAPRHRSRSSYTTRRAPSDLFSKADISWLGGREEAAGGRGRQWTR